MGYVERDKLKEVLAEVVAEHFKQPFVAERMANAFRDDLTVRFSQQSLSTQSGPHQFDGLSATSSGQQQTAASSLAQQRSSAMSAVEFPRTPETSRPYRQAKRQSNFSVGTTEEYNRTWSVFSGLSLSQISSISVLALPIYADDISHPEKFDFGGAPGPARSLFHECVQVEEQLCQLPEFTGAFEEVRRRSVSQLDPLSAFIRVFRKGTPIVHLFEQVALALGISGLDFEAMLESAEQGNFSFIPACGNRLGFDPNDSFHASELTGNNSNDQVKASSPVSEPPPTLF
jgi:CDC24 calponin